MEIPMEHRSDRQLTGDVPRVRAPSLDALPNSSAAVERSAYVDWFFISAKVSQAQLTTAPRPLRGCLFLRNRLSGFSTEDVVSEPFAPVLTKVTRATAMLARANQLIGVVD